MSVLDNIEGRINAKAVKKTCKEMYEIYNDIEYIIGGAAEKFSELMEDDISEYLKVKCQSTITLYNQIQSRG